MKINRFFGLVVFLMSMNCLAGQNVQISLNSSSLTTDDMLVVTVEVTNFSGRIRQPAFPNIEGFNRVGPSTSQRFVNGRSSIGFSFNYSPTQAGTFTVPKINYELNNKRYTFGPKKVTVKKGTGRPKQQRSRDPFADMFRDPFEDFFRDPFGGDDRQESLEFQETNADYFMSFDLNKKEAFLGEQIMGEVRLYINERDARKVAVDGMAIVEMQQRIKNSGFWQEVYDFKTIPMSRATINGKRYLVYTLYRTFLFPLKTGTIEFEDLYLDAKKLYVASNASLKQRVFGQDTKFQPIRIRAPRRELKVKPLPPTDLPNATNVGEFAQQFDLNAKQLNTGEVLELELKLQGNGNMAMVSDPVIQIPKSFKSDPAETRLETKVTELGASGQKEYYYTFIPTRNGRYDLGPVKFYYFNPEREVYDSLVVNSIPIKVTGEDLENIKLKQSKKDDFYQTAFSEAGTNLEQDRTPAWWMVVAPVLLLIGVTVFVTVRNRKQETSPEEPVSYNPLDD